MNQSIFRPKMTEDYGKLFMSNYLLATKKDRITTMNSSTFEQLELDLQYDSSVNDDQGTNTKITPEMREKAEKLTHPDKDPYINAREMGFYCEQCG